MDTSFCILGSGLLMSAIALVGSISLVLKEVTLQCILLPQELGDFGVLVHGGWEKKKALLYNVLSGLAFPVGGLLAYAVSFRLDISFLVPFAAGNFIYIGASDLIPEIKGQDDLTANYIHFMAFVVGIVLLLAVRFFHETP